MKSVPPDAVRDVLALSLAAGCADAVGYLGLGGVFISNMTGNVILFGIALGQRHIAYAARSAYVVVIFMLGAAFAARISRDIAEADWPRLVTRLIALEKVLLLLFAVGWTLAPRGTDSWQCILAALLTVSMALQSVAWTRLKAPGIGTTAITGTVMAFATELVSLIAPGMEETSRARAGFHAGVMFLYLLGGAVSALLILYLPWLAGWVPIAAALLVWSRPNAQIE
jgi:uncharacterized membrane protein YoaK (UPF0700 family)